MRLMRRERSPERARQLRSELAEATARHDATGRVCGDSCTIKCPTCGSTACRCECSPGCAAAPRALSIEPDTYPIEAAILPLVFEMKRLGRFTPCWSCEGHLGPDGKIWKVPRVWFYCDSIVLLRLLNDGLKNLHLTKKLSGQWQVVVAFSDPDNPETTFSLEPMTGDGIAAPLAALQKDVARIASELEAMLIGEARALQREVSASLGSS